MSMTQEEAIEELERLLSHWDDLENGKRSFRWYSKDAVEVSITSLRPVSRERVEKAWGVGAWETVADEGFVDTMGRQVFHLHCPVCDFFWRETGHKKYFRFCPHCSAPMTDEAVQMVMERLEALYGQENT